MAKHLNEINVEMHLQHLQRVVDAIAQKRPELTDAMFLRDNAWACVCKTDQWKLSKA